MSLRVVFMGTPDFAVSSLKSLLAGSFNVVAAYTQPDRRRGRGQQVSFSPVKEAALEAGIPVYQPRSLRDPSAQQELRALAPDVIVVVAFGQLLPKDVLEIPSFGCVNVHASLLPRHRGAAPIQAALAAGDEVTGVTTMFMNEGLDTGDIILRQEVPIERDDNAGTLHDKLARAGGVLLVETLEQLAAGTAPRTPQDDGAATYAPRLQREDAVIRWDEGATAVVNHIRAFAPRPGAATIHRGRGLKILEAREIEGKSEDEGATGTDGQVNVPGGAVVDLTPEGIVVQTGRGRVLLTRVQPAGRAPMSGRDYSNGFRMEPGEMFGEEASSDR